jgi:methionyl-tRNA synthetase
MVEKYFQGKIPQGRPDFEKGEAGEIGIRLEQLRARVAGNLGVAGDINFSAALESIWELINMANKYIEDTKPWNLVKEGKIEQLKQFIVILAEVIKVSAREVYAFMPGTAQSILEQIGQDVVKKGKPLFPRIETV